MQTSSAGKEVTTGRHLKVGHSPQQPPSPSCRMTKATELFSLPFLLIIFWCFDFNTVFHFYGVKTVSHSLIKLRNTGNGVWKWSPVTSESCPGVSLILPTCPSQTCSITFCLINRVVQVRGLVPASQSASLCAALSHLPGKITFYRVRWDSPGVTDHHIKDIQAIND